MGDDYLTPIEFVVFYLQVSHHFLLFFKIQIFIYLLSSGMVELTKSNSSQAVEENKKLNGKEALLLSIPKKDE